MLKHQIISIAMEKNNFAAISSMSQFSGELSQQEGSYSDINNNKST